MKRLIIILLLLLLPAVPAMAIADAEYLYAGYGALASVAINTRMYHCAPKLTAWERVGLAAIGGGLSVAATRELADAASRTDSYSQREFAATMVGAVLGALTSELTNGLFFTSASGDAFLVGHQGRW